MILYMKKPGIVGIPIGSTKNILKKEGNLRESESFKLLPATRSA